MTLSLLFEKLQGGPKFCSEISAIECWNGTSCTYGCTCTCLVRNSLYDFRKVLVLSLKRLRSCATIVRQATIQLQTYSFISARLLLYLCLLGRDFSVAVVNGELYNFKDVLKKNKVPVENADSKSDSEVVPLLFDKLQGDPSFVSEINGIFAFVVSNASGTKYIAARDHCGIKPLFMGKGKNGEVWFASELKAIVDQDIAELKEFPEGHYYTPDTGLKAYYTPVWDTDHYISKTTSAQQYAFKEVCDLFALLLAFPFVPKDFDAHPTRC